MVDAIDPFANGKIWALVGVLMQVHFRCGCLP
jgi:hypothetical protein